MAHLASDAATPGGGAACALTAAQAAALLAMVARLTKSQEGGLDWKQHIIDMDSARAKFAKLVSEDAEAFNKVMQAYAIPKGDERTQSLQKALKSALQPPLETIVLCHDILTKLDPYLKYGNKNVITDSGIAVVLLRAAIESSAYNVEINLKYIKDQYLVEATRKKIHPILENLESTCSKMGSHIYKRIS